MVDAGGMMDQVMSNILIVIALAFMLLVIGAVAGRRRQRFGGAAGLRR